MYEVLYILPYKHLIHLLLRTACYVEPLPKRFSTKMALRMVICMADKSLGWPPPKEGTTKREQHNLNKNGLQAISLGI